MHAWIHIQCTYTVRTCIYIHCNYTVTVICPCRTLLVEVFFSTFNNCEGKNQIWALSGGWGRPLPTNVGRTLCNIHGLCICILYILFCSFSKIHQSLVSSLSSTSVFTSNVHPLIWKQEIGNLPFVNALSYQLPLALAWPHTTVVRYNIRWNIGGTLIWRIARNLCFEDSILVVHTHSCDSNTLLYTHICYYFFADIKLEVHTKPLIHYSARST